MKYFFFLKVFKVNIFDVLLGIELTGFRDSPLMVSPHIAGLRVFVEIVEPGLLGLAAFCSCDHAIFIQIQTKEH